MKWRISFRVDASDDETGIALKDVVVEPVEDN